ncbi:unnamed protein product [Toxocara canis]|uniref:DUF1311 domain-containing protein n=1 Tax=Toxocara canis TaxID=6265 RepID=A0A183UEZ8_TOXCA|nr:unnamed protein product [Toxocara canis]
MRRLGRFLLIAILTSGSPLCNSQFTSQTYPDPRVDPINCHTSAPGPVCDPGDILLPDEKRDLADRISQLLSLTSAIPNTAPACQPYAGKNLEILVAVIEKIGTIPAVPVDIEKFASSLKSRYQNYQDVSACDITVLIVNSRSDRQVFTVAGRDARLTKDILRAAFEHNIAQFKAHRFATGLEGMVEHIASAYTQAHAGQVLLPETLKQKALTFSPPLVASGVRQTTDEVTPIESSSLPSSIEAKGESPIVEVPASMTTEAGESENLWIDIMKQAVARCGNNQERIGKYVQAVVEEAMALSLRLIKDERYSSIEESIATHPEDAQARNAAWTNAKSEFIDDIYRRNMLTIRSAASERCPLKTNFRFVSKYWNLH